MVGINENEIQILMAERGKQMKIGILALQGAFAEHAKVLDQLGVESVEIRNLDDFQKHQSDLSLSLIHIQMCIRDSNELAKKKKIEGLTPEEKVEQAKLREEYIEGYRRTVRHHIEGIKIVDEEGNDVTPEKLRQVQREKGLHGRSLDDPNS